MTASPRPRSAALDTLIAAATLEEKAALTAGADAWHTVPIPRLEVPALRMTDGPSGARGETDEHLGRTPSVWIPSGTALGSTWDPELVSEAAAVVARQARDKSARVLLAPTVNLHRHPLWGRNFEAFSEDPLLTARLAVGYIRGVQGQGVAATVKHLVGNECEFERNTASSDIDERTLRELYLLPFEYSVRLAGVLALMTSYNRVNGRHVPDDQHLLDGVVRGEWGFDGVVMTDWFGMSRTVEAGRAGLDLEMPGPGRSFGPALAEAVRTGEVAAAAVDAKARRILTLLERVDAFEDPPEDVEHPVDRPEDRAICRRAVAEAAVLLSNRGALPLDLRGLRRLALLGRNAAHPGLGGGGSALVLPHYRLSPLDALGERCAGRCELAHEEGGDAAGIERAAALAAAANVAVVVVGTDHDVESEAFDREAMDLPGMQDELVVRVAEANPRTIVVVNTGSPVTMPWVDRPAALLQCWFGGQETANGLVDVLLGEAEPGGRLPTTLPLRLEHTPAFGNFPAESSRVRYGEGLLVGYRWYEARQLPVLFPFGHGLSYTTFELGRPRLSAATLGHGDRLRVTVPVRNTGARAGSEVVQLYVSPPGGGRAVPGGRFRPVKELRGFAKVRLAPGEATGVEMELGERSFAHWDVEDGDWRDLQARKPISVAHGHASPVHRERAGWYVEPGVYRLLIGRSSAEIVHAVEVEVVGGADPLDPSVLPD